MNSLNNTTTEDVPTPENILNDYPWNVGTTAGDVPNSTNTFDKPSMFVSIEDRKLDVKDDLSNEIMFEDENTIVGSILIPTKFNHLQKPFSSKPCFYFDLSSSS